MVTFAAARWSGRAEAGWRGVRAVWVGAGGCGRTVRARGAGACLRRGTRAGVWAAKRVRAARAGSGRATRTGRASPAARALQNRSIIGPWPHITPGVVGRGRHVRSLPWCLPRGARNDSRGLVGGRLAPAQILAQNSPQFIAQNSIRSSSLPRPVPVPSMVVHVSADEFCRY